MSNPQDSQPGSPHQQNQPIHHRRSSSSSSNDAPSEPTINYSSWSPRSYQLALSTPFKWMIKTTPRQPQQIVTQTPTLPSPIARDCSVNLSAPNQAHLQVLSHELLHNSATIDRTPREKIRRICSLINALLPTIPSPVIITPFLSLRPPYYTPLTRRDHREHCDSLHPVHYGADDCGYTQDDILLGVCFSALASRNIHPGLIEWAVEGQGPTNKNILHTTSSHPAQTQPQPSNSEPIQTSLLEIENSFPSILSPTPPRSISEQFPCTPTPPHETAPHLSQCTLPTYTVPDSPLSVSQANMSAPASTSASKKRKNNHLPTRHSERIQARAHVVKIPGKARTPSTKIHFDMQTSLSPLDAATTLAILQASGLQINSRVEQLIDDAIKQDQIDDVIQNGRPSTPLHDLVPPLLIPGADTLL